MLLCPEDTTIKNVVTAYESLIKREALTPFDSERTIGLYETLPRLRKLQKLEFLEELDYQRLLGSVRDLVRYRNRLEHFELEADPEVIGRILGNVIPRSYGILAATLTGLSSRLKELYADAPEVLNHLRNEYDVLIREAVQYLKGRRFPNKPLSLAVQDHGHIGAPPFCPELQMSGLLQAQWDHRVLLDRAMDDRFASMGVQSYSAEVKITKPVIVEDLPSPPDYKSVKGRLDFHATLRYPTAEGLLSLPETGQRVAFLRQVALDITAWLDYEAEALYTDHHYDVVKLYTARGSLEVQTTAISKGYTEPEPELTARYSSPLDQSTSPFRFHAFVEPGGDLKDNHMLEWQFNTLADLLFS